MSQLGPQCLSRLSREGTTVSSNRHVYVQMHVHMCASLSWGSHICIHRAILLFNIALLLCPNLDVLLSEIDWLEKTAKKQRLRYVKFPPQSYTAFVWQR